MKSQVNVPMVTDGPILGHEEIGVAALVSPRRALLGPALDVHRAKLLDHAQGGIDHVIPWQSVVRRQWQRPASLRAPRPGSLHAGPLPPIRKNKRPRTGRDRLLAQGTWISTVLLPTATNNRSDWQRLHRFVSLSGLGWAFVLVAGFWELFAVVFSRFVGWGWDKGAFFFAWGLGILALGFCLRTRPQRPAFSGFFLGVNVIMLGVLSLVVATR